MSALVKQNYKNRNISLDLVKVFAAFAVVCIHYMFYGEVGVIVKAISRFAVPFFFAVSGFFAYRDEHQKMTKKAVHIAKIYFYCFLLYFVYGAVRDMLSGKVSGFIGYIGTYFQKETIFNFLLNNTTISAGHLWFLPALVYCYIIFYFLKKFKLSDKVLLVVSVCLLAVRLLVGEVVGFFGVEIDTVFFPRFLFVGVPFFSFGMFINKHQSRLNKISTATLILTLIAGVLETILSVHFFEQHILYLGTPLIVFTLVVIALKIGDKKYSNAAVTLSQLSTNIYVFHVVIGGALGMVVSRVTHWESSPLWINTKPFIVFVLSVIVSLAFKGVMDFLKNKKEKDTPATQTGERT